MSILDEINKDWQVNGLSPTWAKLQQAKQEQTALIAERDALKAELERINALEPVAMRYDFDGYGWQYIDNGSGSDWLTRHKDGEALYALGSKTA